MLLAVCPQEIEVLLCEKLLVFYAWEKETTATEGKAETEAWPGGRIVHNSAS